MAALRSANSADVGCQGHHLEGLIMGPQNHLSIVVCQDAGDAITKGFDYSAQGDTFKPIEIEQAVVVRNGTQQGNSTVDLVLRDQAGQKYVVMLTGALVKSIPCA